MEEIIVAVAKELGITEDKVRFIINHKYLWIREQLSKRNYPAILDSQFGTFSLMSGKLTKHITMLERTLALRPESSTVMIELEKVKEDKQTLIDYKLKRKRK